MSHLYKMSEWQSADGLWQCNDVEDLAGKSGLWWVPCLILDISAEEFVKMLANEYHVSRMRYSKKYNVLTYSWEKQSDMRKFKNYINKVAREKNFLI